MDKEKRIKEVRKIYHRCPICDRSLVFNLNEKYQLDTWEKVLIHHFNTKHEGLYRQPTRTEIAKFVKGSKSKRKGSVWTISAGSVSPR